MRAGAALAALGTMLALPASAALDGDPGQGKELYSQYCAGQCHTAEVHQREDVKANTQAEIVAWIQRQCTQAMSQDLSIQDIEDLATYLNDKYYQYEE